MYNSTINVQIEWKNLIIQKKLDNMDYNLGENMNSFKHQLASHTKDKNCHDYLTAMRLPI